MDSVMLEKKTGGVETQQRNPAWNICRASCFYRATPGQPWTCDYATITGKTRLAACRELGADVDIRKCPLKREREKRERDRIPAELERAVTARRIRELYDRGMTDRQISGELGISKSSVHRWRKRECLRPHKRGGAQ